MCGVFLVNAMRPASSVEHFPVLVPENNQEGGRKQSRLVPYQKYRYQQLQNMRGKCCPPWGPMGVCGGAVGPRGAPVGPHGAKGLCLTSKTVLLAENNQVCLNTTFKYHIPIPPENNQKNLEYRYGTGKCSTLPASCMSGPCVPLWSVVCVCWYSECWVKPRTVPIGPVKNALFRT